MRNFSQRKELIVFLGGLKFWIFFERKLNEEVITVENLVGLFVLSMIKFS